MIYQSKLRLGYIYSFYTDVCYLFFFFVGYSLGLCLGATLHAYFAPGGRCSFLL